MYVFKYIYLYTSVSIMCIYIYIHVCVCIYVCMYIYTCTDIYIYIYIYAYVCMVITYSKSMHQPGKVANPARGQLNMENSNSYFLVLRSRLRIWSLIYIYQRKGFKEKSEHI